MKKFIRVLWKALKVFFVVFFVFLASLCFREQRLPGFLVERVAKSLSSREVVVRLDAVAFGFRHGLRVAGARVYDMSRGDSLESAVLSVRSALVNVFTRTVRLSGVKYPRLPDSYYEEATEPHVDEPLEFDVPDLPDFKLVVEDSEILGLEPETAVATVETGPGRIRLSGIKINLAGGAGQSALAGEFTMDLATQHARGELTGAVMHSQILPFMEIIDAPSSLPYIEAFSEILAPIPARVYVDVNLTTKGVDVVVDVKPKMGRYNGVPLASAEGTVDFKFRYEGTNGVCRLNVALPSAIDHDGHKLSGNIGIDNAAGPYRIKFDARSALSALDALKMLDLIDPGCFSAIDCFSTPEVNISGTAATGLDDLGVNDIKATVFLKRGALSGFRMNDLYGDFALAGDKLSMTMKANGKAGGKVDISGSIDLARFEPEKMRFDAKTRYRGGSLEELGDTFTFDLGERNGKVDWDNELSGLLNSDSWRSLNGRGRVVVTDGHLAQMKLFGGLTALLAEKIPGVSFLVNQAQASADYTIVNGVFHSDNVYIEGGLISIKGWGSYDIDADNLDFTVRAQFLKEASLMGKIVHPVTLPFTKLLLEFKVHGPIDEPDWRYIKILDRIF